MINLHNLGDTLIRLDDFARAYGALQQSLALCDEFGYERLGSLNRMFLAYLDGVAGRADAEKLLEQGIAYAQASDFVWDAIQGGMMLSALLKRRGDVEGARRGFEKTRELARASGDRLTVADCDAALASA
jgi:hypothetical protein